jgi:hypothetical protein
MRNAGKEGHTASIIGGRQRVDDAGKQVTKGMAVAMTKELSMRCREVANRVRG